MNLFPFFYDISGRTFLIVGGGSVAKEKLTSIARFCERIIIVARQTDIKEEDGISVYRRDFRPEDIELADFVIGATSDRTLNERIALLCREKNIPVNIVDDAALCSFIMPSMVKRGALVAAVSTNGASPAFAAQLRRQIEDSLPDDIEGILERMEQARKMAFSLMPEQRTRRAFFRELLHRLIETDNRLSDEEIREMTERYEKQADHSDQARDAGDSAG